MINVKEKILYFNDIPTLPTIYSSLIGVIDNPKSTIKDVADIISNDMSSSVILLRIMNSSIFGISRYIDTIPEAVSLLGFKMVKDLILSMSIFKVFENEKSISDFNVVELWKHSIAVGVIARILGVQAKVKNVEVLFVSGILHEFGKLILLKIFSGQYVKVINQAIVTKRNLRELEIEILEIDHYTAGEILAEKWGIPETIINNTKYLDPNDTDIKIDVNIACVHLADIIAELMQFGNTGEVLIGRPNPRIWEYLNLKPGTLYNLYDVINEKYNESINILSI